MFTNMKPLQVVTSNNYNSLGYTIDNKWISFTFNDYENSPYCDGERLLRLDCSYADLHIRLKVVKSSDNLRAFNILVRKYNEYIKDMGIKTMEDWDGKIYITREELNKLVAIYKIQGVRADTC